MRHDQRTSARRCDGESLSARSAARATWPARRARKSELTRVATSTARSTIARLFLSERSRSVASTRRHRSCAADASGKPATRAKERGGEGFGEAGDRAVRRGCRGWTGKVGGRKATADDDRGWHPDRRERSSAHRRTPRCCTRRSTRAAARRASASSCPRVRPPSRRVRAPSGRAPPAPTRYVGAEGSRRRATPLAPGAESASPIVSTHFRGYFDTVFDHTYL